MRLLLVGAFPFPYRQGSQAYFQEQAAALAQAGAQVELLTYASGDPELAPGGKAGTALAALPHHRPPAWSAPRKQRSGPSLAKPLADVLLSWKIRDAVASKNSETRFDAVLTHNAEAAWASRIALRKARVPQIYCAHTLLQNELSSYFKWAQTFEFEEKKQIGLRDTLRHRIDDAGAWIDRRIASKSDGWIALTQSAARVMRRYSAAPGALIPPMITAPGGPRIDPEVAAAAERQRLPLGSYFLYSGNLDVYQDLPLLMEAARRLHAAHSRGDRRAPPPMIVVASHDAAGLARLPECPGLSRRHVPDYEEMQRLLRGARANLVMRRLEGGYPIKLANASAVGAPSIVFLGREWGITDGRDGLSLGLEPGASAAQRADALASAIRRLAEDEGLADRLGRGAQQLYHAQHRPDRAAAQTAELIERVRRAWAPSARKSASPPRG